jgi:hypothetical protein
MPARSYRREMPRGVGLTRADRAHDLGHARFSLAQDVQDPKPRGVRQEAEPLGHGLEQVVWHLHN